MATFAQLEMEISAMLDLQDEELSPEQREELDKYLQELGDAEANKVDNFAQFVKVQTARAKAIREEAQRLSARARAIDNRIAGLKEYYQRNMGTFGLTKIQGGIYTVSLRNNKSVQVDDTALEALPLEYKNVKVEPRKTEIKKAIEAGQELAGCRIVETQSLNIR